MLMAQRLELMLNPIGDYNKSRCPYQLPIKLVLIITNVKEINVL